MKNGVNDRNIKLENRALEFATMKHKGQYRKGNNPQEYIIHPEQVAYFVNKYVEADNISTLVATAYLHDTLEDTDTSYSELKSCFGTEVADLVSELTNDKYLKKELGKKDYLAMKMCIMSNDALTIKLCDRLSNVIGLFDVDEDFKNKYISETLYLLDYLVDRRDLSETQLEITKDINNVIKIMTNNKCNKEDSKHKYNIDYNIKTITKTPII